MAACFVSEACCLWPGTIEARTGGVEYGCGRTLVSETRRRHRFDAMIPLLRALVIIATYDIVGIESHTSLFIGCCGDKTGVVHRTVPK